MSEHHALIMDLDNRVSRLICRIGERLGLTCHIIENASDIESSCPREKPNLVMVDLEVPPADIYKLLKHLAERDPCGAVILIGNAEEQISTSVEEHGRSLGLNMVGTLLKPVEVNEIRDRLIRYIQQVDARDLNQLIRERPSPDE